MAQYELIHILLGDPNSYDPANLPGSGDSVDGNGLSARGNLNVDKINNFILTNGTITANSATGGVTVGNPNGVDGAATVTIDGIVTGGATVWSNGHLTADSITGGFSINGGIVSLNLGHNVGSGITMEGGTLDIGGVLSMGAPGTGDSTIFLTDGQTLNGTPLTGAKLTAAGLSLGSGRTLLGMQFGAMMTITGDGAVILDGASGSQFEIDRGSKLEMAEYDVIIRGSPTAFNSSFRIDKGEAHIKSLDIQADGRVSLVQAGGKLTVDGDITNIGALSNFGSELRARNLTLGSSTATHDHCGNWTYTGASGLLGGSGYVSIATTLTLDNANNTGIGLDSSGSLDVGGDHGSVGGRIMVSAGGTITGHGGIDALSVVVDGTIIASEGILHIFDAVSGIGFLRIGDAATLRLQDAATSTLDFVFQPREDTKLGDESVLWLDRPDLFGGATISGLQVGDTIRMDMFNLLNPLGFVAPGLSHASAHASGVLQIAVRDAAHTPGPSAVIDYNVVGLPAGHDFAIRYLAQGDVGFSLVQSSPKLIKGVDGSPTNGANPYIDSLVWGWSKWDVTKGPITYCFADSGDVSQAVDLHGETQLLSCENPTIALNWTVAQRVAFKAATELYSSISNLTFQEVSSVDDANIVLWARANHPDDAPGELTTGDTEFLPHRPDGRLWMFVNNAAGMANPDWLDPGGTAYSDYVHELGHALGLAHPHDGGGEFDANAFPGATDGSPGPNGENQRIFSVMSYNRGWDGERTTSFMFGHNVGLGAFDIAAIQNLYGSKTHNESGNTYLLPSHNVKGTGWQSIWDTGGIDEISNVGSGDDATIDLRAAPLTVGANAGGYVSWVRSIQGGFTIANGVVIERALGGSGDDTLIGNSARNVLDGGRGDDVMTGGAEVDTFVVDGRDTDHITDFGFNGTADVIRVTGVYTSFSQVESHISKVNGDTSIDFGGGNFVILNGFTGALTASHFEFSSAPSGPEISVTGNGITIVDGASTPSGADGSAFGAQPLGALVERTFTVTNHGDATLTTSGLKLPKGFKLASGELLAATILPGQSDTFKVVVDTAKVGTFGGVIIFNTNDADEGSFDFAVSASVVASTAVPNIELLGAGNIIVDGDTTPSATDDTDFGTVGVSEAVIHTFTVNNTGEGTLNISKMKLPKGFVLVEGPSASIPGGGSDTFQVRVDTTKAGAFAGSVTFTTNDPDAKAFDFGLKANVIVIPPEIDVTGNGVAILDNDTSPSITDHTDFGAVPVGDTLTQTFTVNNTGAGVLSISKLKLPKGFVLEEGLSSTIAAGGSDNFTVRIDTAKVGVKAGTVSFTTNDPDEGAFNFNLIGNVTAPTATLASLGEGFFESQLIFEQANQLVVLNPDSNDHNQAYAQGQMHQLDLL